MPVARFGARTHIGRDGLRRGRVMPKGLRGKKRPADTVGCVIAMERLSIVGETAAAKTPSKYVRSVVFAASAQVASLTRGRRPGTANVPAGRGCVRHV